MRSPRHNSRGDFFFGQMKKKLDMGIGISVCLNRIQFLFTSTTGYSMTTALSTLSTTDRHNLASELLDAAADSRNCYASNYHLYRRIFGFYGVDVTTMSTSAVLRVAQHLIAEVPVKAVKVDVQMQAFEAQRAVEVKAKRAAKPKVGHTITYKTPLGEERTGVVNSVSSSGKSIYVTRPDGTLDAASRIVSIIA